ncbi:MAG: RHS repeat-associated core domain-containing protein [Firmicutes bacterium]|nr:RHS repeat-associated core domain-containing protein [Bacillota bacterium]
MAGMTDSVLQSVNNVFEVSWGRLSSDMGVLYSLQKQRQEEARTVRLSWIGNGVLFDVSTDNGKTWETVKNGKITRLKNPGRKIVVKALLPIDSNTFLDNYILEINPSGYSLFTGKVLEESTGLVYFGGRWYDPEIARWITPDPAEDGENWYSFVNNNPINNIDLDGYFTSPWQVLHLAAGIIEESAIMAVVATMMGTITPYISPVLPMLVPVLVYMGAEAIINDVTYMIKNFNHVFLGRPTDNECRLYGKAIARSFSIIIFGAASVKRVKGYSSSRQFQNKSGWGKGTKEWPWHHLTQQHSTNTSQFGKGAIHNIFNMVKIPKNVHIRINKYICKNHEFTGGKVFWKWVSEKSYAEQYIYGIKILVKAYLNLL